MKFRLRRASRWSSTVLIGVKNGFCFTIARTSANYYVSVIHKSKDIRYNSLWEHLEFQSEESAELFCEMFDYEKYKCLGRDV